VPFLVLVLLLTTSLTAALKIQPVSASGTLYIRADGSIDPPTAPIQRNGDVYTFTDNIYDSIMVERSNAIVDGNGYILEGSGSLSYMGLNISNTHNITVKNVTIKSFGCGIYLNSTSDNTIFDVVLGGSMTERNHEGICLEYSSNNSIFGNSLSKNDRGISLGDSLNNSIIANNIVSATEGISLAYSSNNSITANSITDNGNGVLLYSFSDNNSISGNSIARNTYGIYSHTYSSNNSIIGNNITDSRYGIWLEYSSNNSISGNNITTNNIYDSGYGIRSSYSFNNSIGENNIMANNHGIYFEYFSNSSIAGNNIADNAFGAELYQSSGNRFYHNNFVNNDVYSYNSENVWDNGYPSGGNYWSDYNGTDANNDGIGDTPYIIDANNTDSYPLIVPFAIPEFPLFFILPLFMTATSLAVIVYRRKTEVNGVI